MRALMGVVLTAVAVLALTASGSAHDKQGNTSIDFSVDYTKNPDGTTSIGTVTGKLTSSFGDCVKRRQLLITTQDVDDPSEEGDQNFKSKANGSFTITFGHHPFSAFDVIIRADKKTLKQNRRHNHTCSRAKKKVRVG